MNNPTSAFRAVIEAAGLRPGESVLADGQLHRCPVDGKPNARDGAYVLHLDAPAASGWWQNWRTGEDGKWTAKEASNLSPAERQALQARIEADRRARQEEKAKRHAEAAGKAVAVLDKAILCRTHPYLARKGVKPCPGLKVDKDGRLLVPVLAPEDGKPMSLQTIAEDGGKLFLSGGRMRGGFFPVKGQEGRLYVCEGLATGLSIHEATGQTVLCAFNAGNLEAVAAHARQKYPDRELVLCADNDHATDGNPGLSKATAAALAVGASLAVPSFKEPAGRTDFNDLHQAEGLDVVRAQLAGAAKLKAESESVTTPTLKRALRVVNMADLLTMDLPERGHILYPVIPEQGLVMLYAPRGLGKTWAALSIAYAVASGQSVFGGWKATEPRRVLYLDGEMPARTMKERLASIAAGCDGEPPDADYLRILTPDLQPDYMPNIATPEGQAELAPFLDGVDLVVVDNIATLGRHGRENESESWTPVQEWLLRLRRMGKAVLLIHHAGKGGNQRGTSAREDILDTVIAMRRPEDYQTEQGARFEVHLEKARGVCGPEARSFEAALRMDNGVAAWTTRQIEDVELERVAALKSEGMTVRDIADETGLSKSKVQRLIKRLGVAA